MVIKRRLWRQFLVSLSAVSATTLLFFGRVEAASSSALDALNNLAGAGSAAGGSPVGSVYPRRFGTETLKADYDSQDQLVLLLEKSEELSAPAAPPVTLHRLTQFFGPSKGSQNSEWANGIPRSLTVHIPGQGVRSYSHLRSAASGPTRSFETPLSEELFEEQVFVSTEGRERVEVRLKRDASGHWIEISRKRSEIKPSHS